MFFETNSRSRACLSMTPPKRARPIALMTDHCGARLLGRRRRCRMMSCSPRQRDIISFTASRPCRARALFLLVSAIRTKGKESERERARNARASFAIGPHGSANANIISWHANIIAKQSINENSTNSAQRQCEIAKEQTHKCTLTRSLANTITPSATAAQNVIGINSITH